MPPEELILRISRRHLLAGSLVAAPAVLSSRALAQAKRKVTFTLPFLAEGSNAYAFVARAAGYWDELGLDVQISRGYGSVAAAQAIGAGQFQFGLAAATAAIQQAAKGLPLVSIACAGYDATMGVCVLKDSPIRTPADLAGKKLGATVTSGEYPFLPAFAKVAGFDLKSVDVVQVDPAIRQRVLLSRQVDCVSGFAVSFVPPVVSQKQEVRSMLFSQYGLKYYNNALLTQPATLRDDPKLCANIAAGLTRAIKLTMLDPEQAAQLFLKQVPEAALSPANVEALRLGIGIFNNSMLYEPARVNGVGFVVPGDYAWMVDQVMQYVAGPNDKAPKAADLFTNDLVGTVTLSPAEWEAAKSNAAPFKVYLGDAA